MEKQQCPRCRTSTLVGLSNGGRAAAVDVRLDPDQLTTTGELDAIRSGRRTWTLHAVGDVFARSAATITRWPAGQGWRRTVHADHRCGQETGA